jgi:hypothetical protein
MSNISRGLVAEAFNYMFAKYGKPEIAPMNRKDRQGMAQPYDRLPRISRDLPTRQRANIPERADRNGSPRRICGD